MKWISTNQKLPKRYSKVLCLYPNGKMDVQLYLGKDSFRHELYGDCIFWQRHRPSQKHFMGVSIDVG